MAVINNKREKLRKKTKKVWSAEKLAGAVIWRCSVRFFEKLYKIQRKIPVLESVFNKVSGLQT